MMAVMPETAEQCARKKPLASRYDISIQEVHLIESTEGAEYRTFCVYVDGENYRNIMKF